MGPDAAPSLADCAVRGASAGGKDRDLKPAAKSAQIFISRLCNNVERY